MTNQTINWTQSTGGKIADDLQGKLTIGNTATAGTAFVPGSKVYLTGVHGTTATVVNAEVVIGLEAKVATTEIKGVYNIAKKTIEELPSDFQASKYVLLFEAKDQYGNKINIANLNDLTVLSDNPLFVAQPSALGSDVTINNVVYKALALVPGTQATKGGTANIQLISNNTGKVSKYTITSEAQAALASFQISTPAELVAGTDKVEIPFTAVDQYGNAITKFADLNLKVSLVATDGGTFQFEQQKDGSAKLFYTAATNATGYDKVVSLTSTVTANGNYSNVQVTVKEDAQPTTVAGLSNKISTQISKGNNVTFKAEDLLVQDQYGRNLTKAQINAWIATTNNAVVIASTVGGTTAFEVTSTNDFSDVALAHIKTANDVFTITAANAATDTEEKLTISLSTTASVAAIPTSSKSITFTSVAQSEYASYEVEDFGTMYNNGTPGTATTGYDITPKVYGIKADGSKVKLQSSKYAVTVDTTKLTVSSNVIKDHASAGFDKAVDFKDGATKTVKVTIIVNDKYGAAAATIVKDLVVTNADQKAETITLDSTKVTNGAAFAEPASTAIADTVLKGVIKEVKDQYGVVNATLLESITISEVTPVDGSNFTVTGNATASAAIAGAKAGDKFTVTYKFAGGKTETVKFTVSPDSDTTAPTATVDKAALNAAIAAVEYVAVSTDGSDIATTEKWTTAEVKKALEDAVTAAQAVVDKAEATQEEVNEAVEALGTAVSTYTDAQADGTKVETPATYTVTFDSKEGSVVDSIEGVAKDATVTLPTAPTKEGFIFGGWFTDEALTTEFTVETTVTADVTVYAKWEEDTSALEAAAFGAKEYIYDPVYNYSYESLDTEGNVATISYNQSAVTANPNILMNDLARYLGALYRFDNGTTVQSIGYSGNTYNWVGTLKGSNWKTGDVSLVGVITAQFVANPTTFNEITLTLTDVNNNSIDLTLKFVVINE